MPYWIFLSQWNISNKLVSTPDRDFPGFLPVGMKGIWGWLLSQAYQIPTARNLHYAHMSMIISSLKNTDYFVSMVCRIRIKRHTTNIMPGFRMLAFQEHVGGVLFFEICFHLQNPILRKFKSIHNFKNSTKKLFRKFSNKYENKLDRIWGTIEKESSQMDLYLKSYSQSKSWSKSVFK
jgi:hypothetical protein